MIQFVKESSLREDGGGREGDTEAFPWKDACPSRRLHYPKKYNDSRCKSPKWVLMFNFCNIFILYHITSYTGLADSPSIKLCEKWPNKELFLVLIFLYSNCIQRFTQCRLLHGLTCYTHFHLCWFNGGFCGASSLLLIAILKRQLNSIWALL